MNDYSAVYDAKHNPLYGEPAKLPAMENVMPDFTFDISTLAVTVGMTMFAIVSVFATL